MQPNMCIFGFGYTADFFAQKLSLLHFEISGTSRDPVTRERRQQKGYQVVDFNIAEVEPILRRATHVLIATPPESALGDPVLAHFRLMLQKISQQLQWVGYLSSTGIYGDHQGAWVDESAVPRQLGTRGEMRLAAEQQWLNFAKESQVPLHIFRLAGIYGPKRNVLTELVNGKSYSVYKEEQFFSRIHVADIVNILLASIRQPQPYAIYNVADDEPTPSHIVDQYAAQLLKRAPPSLVPFEKASLSTIAREFYSNNRRVDNAKIKQSLGIKLLYSSYRQGLLQLYQSGDY